MGGFEFLEAIKDDPEEKKCKSIMIIFTPSSQERNKELTEKISIVKDFIVKPLIKDILEEIFNLLKRNNSLCCQLNVYRLS